MLSKVIDARPRISPIVCVIVIGSLKIIIPRNNVIITYPKFQIVPKIVSEFILEIAGKKQSAFMVYPIMQYIP